MDIPGATKMSLKRLGWQSLGASWVLSLAIALLALAIGAPARSQEPPPTSEAIAKAAREAREHQANSTAHPKIITNDNLVVQSPVPGAPPSAPEPPSAKEAEAPKPTATGCDSPDAERLKAELQSAQDELDQIRSEISSQTPAMSTRDVDLRNLKPGGSGLNVGATPLLETKPPSSARVAEVSSEEKVASLKKAVKIACGSKEDAETQAKLDRAEEDLKTLQRQLDIDQYAYYSKTNYADDKAGKAQLDAELAQKQTLESEIERLKAELAAPKPN